MKVVDRKANEGEIYGRYYPVALEYLNKMMGDRMAAEDLAQESLLILLQRIRGGELRDIDNLNGYVTRVAWRLWVGWLRRGDVARLQYRSYLPEDLGSVVVDRVDDEMRFRRGIGRLLLRLRTARDRELLTRFYVYEEPKPVICSELGLTPQRFDGALHRARNRLQKQIKNLANQNSLTIADVVDSLCR